MTLNSAARLLKKFSGVFLVLTFIAIGVYVLGKIHAATGSLSLEAENGTLSNNAVKVTDTTASGSTAVKFPDIVTPPPPPPTGSPVPTGVPGTWTLKFQDEFNGTALDKTKWDPNWFGEGGSMNSVGTYEANVSVHDGNLWLQLDNPSGTVRGSLIHTNYSSGRYQLSVGSVAEARVYFPGTSTQDVYNWPAWWASGPNWPSAGEHDIAEGLGGDLTVNYHGTTNSQNFGTPSSPPWGNAFHTFTLYRKASSADVYWDGKLVKSYATGDNGQGEELILNVGKSGSRTPVTGTAGAMRVDYVRAWGP